MVVLEKPLLDVKNLSAGYNNNILVLKDINLKVFEKNIICILGANGAGKSTILKTISGIVKIYSGSIEFNNENINSIHTHKLTSKGIAHCPEGRQIFGTLSVYENLIVGSYVLKKPDPKIIEWIYDLFPILKDRTKQLAGTLSGGEQQMLAIARAMMSKPKLLMLDEPSLGIAPILAQRIFSAIEKIAKANIAILLVEQNTSLALKVSNFAYVMELGKIIESGSSEDILNSKIIQEAYLGKKIE